MIVKSVGYDFGRLGVQVEPGNTMWNKGKEKEMRRLAV